MSRGTGIKTEWDLIRNDNGSIELVSITGDRHLQQFAEKFLPYGAWRCRLSAIFRAESEKKTPPQMKYYRGALLPAIHEAMNELGNEWDLEQTHEFLKSEFYNEEIYVEGLDRFTKISESLADAGKERMSAYIDRCFRFGNNDLGITILTPEEYYKAITERNKLFNQ